MRWIAAAPAAVVAAALLACGASANAPDDGKKDGGNIPLYDGGSDYLPDAGGPSSGCDTTSVTNCGACGNVCPGLDASSDNVLCGGEAGSSACTFSCQGEHYDVDQDPSDGCEIADTPEGNHTIPTAISLGSVSCHDDSSAQNLSGSMPSDERVHEEPSIDGFSVVSGSAADYWTIVGSGGTCDDDLNLTLTITGSSMPTCYTLTATTSSAHGPYNCTVGPTGSCSISNGSGSYSDGDTLVWYVTRTCSAVTPEAVTYAITGHL
ncbi:MAG: hypothetical protein ACRELY_21440 [Polyangiaceae bacterium]